MARRSALVAQTVRVAGPPHARKALGWFAERHPGLPAVELVVPGADGRFGEDAADVKILWSHFVWSPSWFRSALRSLPALEWIHNDFTGLDGFPLDEIAGRGIVYTNGAGNQARAIAEWIVLYLLSSIKHFPEYVRQSDAGVWDTSAHLGELGGKVVLFVGYGPIAQQAAKLLAPFDLEVRIAVRRPRDVLPPPVLRAVTGESWREELRHVDFVVNAAPATPQTYKMFDRSAFFAMRQTAVFVNVGRGSTVDEAALLEALDERRIAGAYLDCFTREPLAPDHPLWRRKNVIVTPHWSWNSPKTYARAEALFLEQLERRVEGEPLRNVVDLYAGY
jgi:phosphoglycerate dehydrogenase-like enzyme